MSKKLISKDPRQLFITMEADAHSPTDYAARWNQQILSACRAKLKK